MTTFIKAEREELVFQEAEDDTWRNVEKLHHYIDSGTLYPESFIQVSGQFTAGGLFHS